jgi:hypothetical protein
MALPHKPHILILGLPAICTTALLQDCNCFDDMFLGFSASMRQHTRMHTLDAAAGLLLAQLMYAHLPQPRVPLCAGPLCCPSTYEQLVMVWQPCVRQLLQQQHTQTVRHWSC